MQFAKDADRLHLKDAKARREFNTALMEFAPEVNWSPGALAYVQNQLRQAA